MCEGGEKCGGGDTVSGDWVRGLIGLTGLVGCMTTYSSGTGSCGNLGSVILLNTGRGGGTGGPWLRGGCEMVARLLGLARLERAVVGKFTGSMYASGCCGNGCCGNGCCGNGGLAVEGQVW